MPNTYLDGLALSAGGHIGINKLPAEARDFLAHAILMDAGIVFSTVADTVASADIHFVNSAALALTKYANLAAYAAAVVLAGFVHTDDLPVVEDHLKHKASTTYDARIKRGDNGQYKKCRIQGLTFAVVGLDLPLRITILRDAP